MNLISLEDEKSFSFFIFFIFHFFYKLKNFYFWLLSNVFLVRVQVIFLTLKTKLRLLRQHVGRGSSLTERSSDRNISRDLRMQTAYSLVTGKKLSNCFKRFLPKIMTFTVKNENFVMLNYTEFKCNEKWKWRWLEFCHGLEVDMKNNNEN